MLEFPMGTMGPCGVHSAVVPLDSGGALQWDCVLPSDIPLVQCRRDSIGS